MIDRDQGIAGRDGEGRPSRRSAANRNPTWPLRRSDTSGQPRRDNGWWLQPPPAASIEEAEATGRVVGFPGGTGGRES
jgi:hypothetical protein